MTIETEGGAQPGAEHEAAPAAALEAGEQHQEQPGAEQGGAEAGADGQAPEGAAAGGEKPDGERRTSAQERIDELTRKRRDAEREAEFWKTKALGKDKPAEPDPAPAERAQDAEPDPAEYAYGETDPAYVKALGAYAARQEFARLAKAQEQRSHEQAIAQTWDQRQQAFAKDKPDYYDQVDRADLPISPPMADAIRTSDTGPAVAYHLAQNPDEARRIAGLTPIAQIREIGRLEARLTAPPTAQPLKTISDAPPPAPQARGKGGHFKVDPSTDDFAAFEKAYPD